MEVTQEIEISTEGKGEREVGTSRLFEPCKRPRSRKCLRFNIHRKTKLTTLPLQIFLVDDALSMKPHWPDVVKFFLALSYLTKTVDDDGLITLHFSLFQHIPKIKVVILTV